MSFTFYTLENSRGLAEKIRIMFAETGLKYEEVQISQETAKEWAAAGKLIFPELPALEHDGRVVHNSTAIIEFVAEMADSLGRGQGGNKYCGEAHEKPVIRGLNNMVSDFQAEIQTFNGPAATPANAKDIIAKWFGIFQEILERNDDGDVKTDEYLYGKHLTFADIALFETVNAVSNVHTLMPLRKHPKLKEFHDKVAYRARIDQHIATRAEGF